MKIRFIDLEIERYSLHACKYYLEEVVSENESNIILETNDIKKVHGRIGQLALNGIQIEFVENESLKNFRRNLNVQKIIWSRFNNI